MGSPNRTLLIDAATLAAPLALVLAARVFFAPAPSMAGPAPASQQPPAPPAAPAAKQDLTTEQRKAADWLAANSVFKGIASPLDHPVAAPPTPAPEPTSVAQEPEPAPPENPLAGLKLTGILGTDSAGLAAINGRVYRVGDQVRRGLIVKSIDAKTGAVVFSQEGGQDLTLRRPRH